MGDPLDSVPVHSDPKADGSMIRVMDGAVYLPEGRTVAVESKEFDQLLRNNLPPEIASDVLVQWKGGVGRTTRLQWLATVLALLAAGAFLYYFFPRVKHQVLEPKANMKVVDFSQDLRSNSPYREEYERALLASRKGNYHEAVRILKDSVEDIIRKGDRESDSVLFLYFDSLLKLKDINTEGEGAADQLRVLRDSDPDNTAWAQFLFELDPRIRLMRDYKQVYRLLQKGEFRNALRSHLLNVDYALKQLGIMRTLVNPVKFPPDRLKQYREHFDLFEVQLRISRWLLVGTAAGGGSLPDNMDDPGVEEREKALFIAMRHESSSCEDFWLARRFIAETLCRNDSLFNHIYWNGQYLKTIDMLQHEISICNQRLNRRTQP